jgi:hypothetical protein
MFAKVLSAWVFVSPQYAAEPAGAFGSSGEGVVPLWKMSVVPAGTSTARAMGNFEPPARGCRTISAARAPGAQASASGRRREASEAAFMVGNSFSEAC